MNKSDERTLQIVRWLIFIMLILIVLTVILYTLALVQGKWPR